MNRLAPFALVVALLVAFRYVGAAFPDTLPNFQPLSAMFFCGALLAPGWRGLAWPSAVWAATFPLGIGHTPGPGLFLTTLLAFVALFFLGRSLSSRGVFAMIAGSVAAAVIFHVFTGALAWSLDPRYAKTVTGLWQSLWAGAPGDVLPSWAFLRNLAMANALFTGIILLARVKLPIWQPLMERRPVVAPVRIP